jgi:hypothetical protein
MRAYAVEGLDCSGKKTITRLVKDHLRGHGLAAEIVIGPLLGGGLGRLDARLANITSVVRRGSPLDVARRSLYAAEPLLDRHRHPGRPTLKVSTHYRAWARAEIEDDRWMSSMYRITGGMHVRYAGATLLATDFATRLGRHRADVATGHTTKDESRRFFGPSSDAFDAWHTALDRLMTAHVPCLLRLDSSTADPAELAELIARHAAACWRADR